MVVAAAVGFAGASYFALIVWAALSGAGLGGPLVLPLMLLAALIGGTAIALAVFLPTTAFSEWICRKYDVYFLFQIPIAALVLVAGLIAAASAVAAARAWSIGFAAWSAAAASLLLLVPLGVYWWCLQSTAWLLGLAANALSRLGPPGDDGNDREGWTPQL